MKKWISKITPTTQEENKDEKLKYRIIISFVNHRNAAWLFWINVPITKEIMVMQSMPNKKTKSNWK